MFNWLKSKIRVFMYRKNFPNSIIHDEVIVSKDSEIGIMTVLFQRASIISSSIGAYSYIQKGTVISNVEIGKYCSIAAGVTIGLSEHPTQLISTSPVFYDNSQPLPDFFVSKPTFIENPKTTLIGNDVWIGLGVIVKSGVKIGTGAIVGAGSVVVKDVEAYSIVGGVPAKRLKWRFDETVRKGLLSSKWWELDRDDILDLASEYGNPESFIKHLSKLQAKVK